MSVRFAFQLIKFELVCPNGFGAFAHHPPLWIISGWMFRRRLVDSLKESVLDMDLLK